MVDRSSARGSRIGPRGWLLLAGGMGRSAYYAGKSTPFVLHGQGCMLRDETGRELIDVNGNFTTLVHGNAHPQLIEAASQAMRSGTCWGIPNSDEWDHAELLLARFPCLDQVRYTNSGTEAVMTAIRIARAATGRAGCIMVGGGYHGTSDVALSNGSDKDRRGVPDGVTRDVTAIVANDLKSLSESIHRDPQRYAAILLDLLPNRAGLIRTDQAFIDEARALATRYGIVLIVDEVISIRLGVQGLCGEYGVQPDMVVTGKVIGGGFPVGAVMGRESLMREVDPARSNGIPLSGTFSGNPVSMAAGAESLRLLTPDAIGRLNRLGDLARTELSNRISKAGWEVRGRGSLLRPFPPAARAADTSLPSRLWWSCYERGVLLSTANLVSLSTPMGEEVVTEIVDRISDAVLSIEESRKEPG